MSATKRLIAAAALALGLLAPTTPGWADTEHGVIAIGKGDYPAARCEFEDAARPAIRPTRFQPASAR